MSSNIKITSMYHINYRLINVSFVTHLVIKRLCTNKNNSSSDFSMIASFTLCLNSCLLSIYRRLVMPLIECSTHSHVESQEKAKIIDMLSCDEMSLIICMYIERRSTYLRSIYSSNVLVRKV